MLHFHFEQTYHAEHINLPDHCAVCDAEHAEPFNYVQGHFPIAIPGFGGVHTQTHVAIPYCKYHADAFHFRFRVLGILQYVIIAIGIVSFYWGFILQDQQGAKNSEMNVQIIFGFICFCPLLPGSLLLRRFLYDAFFVVRPGYVQIKSKYPHFLERITEANPWLEEQNNNSVAK
jgi:hypothetical protein